MLIVRVEAARVDFVIFVEVVPKVPSCLWVSLVDPLSISIDPVVGLAQLIPWNRQGAVGPQLDLVGIRLPHQNFTISSKLTAAIGLATMATSQIRLAAQGEKLLPGKIPGVQEI